MADGQVVFEISADGRKATAAIEDITKAMQKAGKQWEGAAESSSENVQKSFQKAFNVERVKNWAIQASKALIDFGKAAIDAASDLEEVQNVVDVTFGDNAAQINAWAKQAISQFGLTETKAKQFASTLGAMMKSAGVSGDAIVEMSENMAGLAADMASFYNLDFDTAFQKIRSGISGETEPLKQLGINMSVANLNAFALKEGLEKTFEQMTQGEQTMLRYQYLMQATADAQGDFSRTSDGYANSLRLLESNIDALKTKFGELLVGPLAQLTTWANSTLERFLNPSSTTVLDTFNSINLDTETKIADIQAISEKANDLIATLGTINTAPVQNNSLASFISSLSENFTGLGTALELAEQGNYVGAVQEIANSLALQTGTDATQWETLLTAISNNLPDVTSVTSGDTSTASFLTAAAEAANKLGGNYPTLWKTLLEAMGEEKAINALKALATYAQGAGTMGTLAIGANKLNAEAAGRWDGMISAFDGMEGFEEAVNNAKSNNYAGTIDSLADALSKSTNFSKDQWSTLLQEIGTNLPDANDATDGESVSSFLQRAAAAANTLGGEYPSMWKSLVDALGSDAAGAMVSALAGGENAGTYLWYIAQSANKLNDNSSARWEAMIGAFSDVDSFKGAVEAAKTGDYAGTIDALAGALSNTTGFQKGAWSTLLSEIGAKLPAANTATNGETVSSFLEAAAAAADDLGGDYPAMWKALVEALGSDKASAMVSGLAGGEAAGTNLGGIARSANLLNADTQAHWGGFMSAVQKVTGTMFGNSAKTAKDRIDELAKALSGESLDMERGEAFKELITTLANNAEMLTGLSGTTAEGTKEFLTYIADAANKLDPNDAEGWSVLLTGLATALSGWAGTTAGDDYFNTMSQYFLAMGNDSEIAAAGLRAMGMQTEDIEDAQRQWLATCHELIRTIPGLADIINAETGEVQGGTQALEDYVEEWKRQQESLLLWKAHYAKKNALAEAENSIYGYRVTAGQTQKTRERIAREIDEAYGEGMAQAIADYVKTGKSTDWTGIGQNIFKTRHSMTQEMYDDVMGLVNAIKEEEQAAAELEKQEVANAEAAQKLADEEEFLNEQHAEGKKLYDEEAQAAKGLTTEQEKAAQAAQKSATELQSALKELNDYVESVRSSTESAIRNVVNGFQSIETPAQKAQKTMDDLIKQKKALDKEGMYTAEYKAAFGSIPTITNMTEGLKSQLEYMKQYQEYLRMARERGVDEEILSALSDGSQESYDYLKVLAEGKEDITELNTVYRQVQAEAEKMTDTLTEQKLSTDDAFDGILQKVNELVAGIDLGDEAKKAALNTMAGLLEGLQALEPSIEKTVNDIIATMDKLTKYGITTNGTTFNFNGSWSAGSGTHTGLSGGTASGFVASNEVGNDYIPINGYFSVLHEGEAILNAEEARVWREFKYGANSTRNVDYDALGGLMRDNVKAGGNVYLDGRTVGRVISAQQANDFRTLERSGWQQ